MTVGSSGATRCMSRTRTKRLRQAPDAGGVQGDDGAAFPALHDGAGPVRQYDYPRQLVRGSVYGEDQKPAYGRGDPAEHNGICDVQGKPGPGRRPRGGRLGAVRQPLVRKGTVKQADARTALRQSAAGKCKNSRRRALRLFLHFVRRCGNIKLNRPANEAVRE